MTMTDQPTQSDYTRDELDTHVRLDLTLGQLLALRRVAERDARRDRVKNDKRPFTPAPGKRNSITEAIARKEALVAMLDATLDSIDEQLEDQP